MLQELRVENLLLIDRAELRLAPGLNVVTGETGAGKTLLAQALDLLLGGRAGSGVVRAGAAEAYVEGVFSIPPELAGAEVLPTGAEEIVLARRVWPDGRTRAYVCGRSATVADLRELGSVLLSFYGQHEHRKLMLSAVQLDVLDAHCGSDQVALRELAGGAYARVRGGRGAEAECASWPPGASASSTCWRSSSTRSKGWRPARTRRRAGVERERLRHLETLQGAAAGAAEAISPEDGSGGAAELLAQAAAPAERPPRHRPASSSLAERAEALALRGPGPGRGLPRSYASGWRHRRGGLEEVEERLALFARLERKHGGSIADVLAHAERCRARREELERAEIALAEVEAALGEARAELDRWPASCPRAGGRRRRRSPRRCASGWPSWPCPTPSSRSRSPRGRTGAGRAGATR